MPARHEYLTLNAMRGVAALGVAVFHGCFFFGPLAPSGFLAVDLFFVLSGFVIAHAYAGRFSAGMSVAEFTRIRGIRFAPFYFAGLGVGAIYELLLIVTHKSYALGPSDLAQAVILGAFFLPVPLHRRGWNLFPVNIPSWSLFFELLVNIAYSAAFPILRRSVLIAVTLVSAVVLALLARSTGLRDVGATLPTIGAAIPRTLFSFTLGVLLQKMPLRASRVPVPAILAAVAACLIVPWGPVAQLGIVFVIGPALVLVGAAAEPRRFRKAAHMLGLSSFPLYSLHRPVLHLAEAVTKRLDLRPGLVGATTLLALSAFCAFIAVPLDVRVRKTISAWLHERERRDPAETAAP